MPRVIQNTHKTEIIGHTTLNAATEMKAWDRLGPKTRAALNYSPFSQCAWNLLQQAKANGHDPAADYVDRMIAGAVQNGCVAEFGGPIEDFLLKPRPGARRRRL